MGNNIYYVPVSTAIVNHRHSRKTTTCQWFDSQANRTIAWKMKRTCQDLIFNVRVGRKSRLLWMTHPQTCPRYWVVVYVYCSCGSMLHVFGPVVIFPRACIRIKSVYPVCTTGRHTKCYKYLVLPYAASTTVLHHTLTLYRVFFLLVESCMHETRRKLSSAIR